MEVSKILIMHCFRTYWCEANTPNRTNQNWVIDTNFNWVIPVNKNQQPLVKSRSLLLSYGSIENSPGRPWIISHLQLPKRLVTNDHHGKMRQILAAWSVFWEEYLWLFFLLNFFKSSDYLLLLSILSKAAWELDVWSSILYDTLIEMHWVKFQSIYYQNSYFSDFWDTCADLLLLHWQLLSRRNIKQY